MTPTIIDEVIGLFRTISRANESLQLLLFKLYELNHVLYFGHDPLNIVRIDSRYPFEEFSWHQPVIVFLILAFLITHKFNVTNLPYFLDLDWIRVILSRFVLS